MKRLVFRIVTRLVGEGNGQFVLSKGKSSGNVLVALYRQSPMGRKKASFGAIYQKLFLEWHLLNYKDMFVETPIYIRYVVLTIVIFTHILAIGLFYLTQLCSFIGCLF